MTPRGYRAFAFSFVVLSLIAFALALTPAARGAEAEWYAGIELGSKGIKVVALPVDAAGKPELNRLVKKLPHKALNNITLGDLKEGKFRPEAIEEAEAAVKDFYEQLTGVADANHPKLSPANIWIVSSSGLLIDRPSNYPDLEMAVKRATGGAKSLLAITQKREVELLMRGAIPPDQWDNSMIVDVGNGNTKCGYLQSARPPQVEHANVPNLALKGTGGYRKAIDLSLKQQKFADDFKRFCVITRKKREEIKDDVTAEIDRYPGFRNSKRTRVYLSGGSPYAIASLLFPVEMARDDVLEVPLPIERLQDFEKEILEVEQVPQADLKGLSPDDVKRAETQMREVRDIFDERSILIGAEILLGFNDALHWDQDKKELFFTKSGLVAWIAGFVVEERAKAKATLSPPQ